MRSDFSNTVTEMAGAIQLIGRGEPRRTRSDDRDLLPRARGRRLRRDPSFVERAVDDRDLDRLDRDRVVVDAEHARAFARRGTQPAGELRESCSSRAADRSPRASDRGRRDRSSRESGCRAGIPGGRTECRSPCSARPAPSGRPSATADTPRASRGRARRPAASDASSAGFR